ncbi:MAG: hypothetical protein AB7F41_03180 [Methylocystis sp.]|uniref:hypothetical protein n=1 Tax=Methylocystis sp. TaxID=1911079 RepID=UPI003D12FF5F
MFRKVDESVENATRGASRLAIVWILSLLALGFATAAGHGYATRMWGEITGNLVIAGAFLFAAFVVYFATANRQTGLGETQASTTAELEHGGLSALPFAEQLLNPDGDLMRSLGASITAMAPAAAKAVAQRVTPNLHLIAGAAVGLMVASKLAEKLDSTKTPET